MRGVFSQLLGSLLIALLLAGSLFAGRAAAVEPLLPNLVADPPDGSELTTDSSSGTARLLLRFNGYIHNVGPGALDFRGSREAPHVSAHTLEEVERARQKQESLPQAVEEQLAVPSMSTSQRLFLPSVSELNPERAHVDEPSTGEMLYVSADGHHHWHLQRIAKYSLWNSARTAEVAPSQKVGFCLTDSQHVEPGVGPVSAVYADNTYPFQDFCQRYRPEATSVFEGISRGWRDAYTSGLAYQWVDVSDVQPGEYWLREDVNPLGVVQEAGGANVPAYAAAPTIIPGFDALPQALAAPFGGTSTLTLSAQAFADAAQPVYRIVTPPAHGTLGSVQGDEVSYSPTSGYSGPDSFTFSASDPNSRFPEEPDRGDGDDRGRRTSPAAKRGDPHGAREHDRRNERSPARIGLELRRQRRMERERGRNGHERTARARRHVHRARPRRTGDGHRTPRRRPGCERQPHDRRHRPSSQPACAGRSSPRSTDDRSPHRHPRSPDAGTARRGARRGAGAGRAGPGPQTPAAGAIAPRSDAVRARAGAQHRPLAGRARTAERLHRQAANRELRRSQPRGPALRMPGGPRFAESRSGADSGGRHAANPDAAGLVIPAR